MSDTTNETSGKAKVFGLEVDAVRPSSSGYLMIAPDDVGLGQNGRWLDHPEELIEQMYRSFVDDGQLQPVTVRRIGSRVELVMGYRRLKAALLYNTRHADNPIRLKCQIVTCNAEEALRRNIAENRVRSETSAVDDAHNQRRLREDHGWTDKKIAEFYGYSVSYVNKLKVIPGLARAVQHAVHEKQLSIDNAAALADMSEPEQVAMLDTTPQDAPVSVPADEGKSTGPSAPTATLNAKITKKRRAKKIAKGGAVARSMREVREFLDGLTGPAEVAGMKEFAEHMLWFVQGKITDTKMADYLHTVFPQPATE